MKILLVILFFGLTVQAGGVRYVGNGGGDAELKLLEMYSHLNLWAKACRSESSLCFDFYTIKIDSSLAKLQALNTESIEISFYGNAENETECNEQIMSINNSDLYIENTRPKTNLEIFRVLTDRMNSCLLTELPKSRVISIPIYFNDMVSIYRGTQTDLMVSSFDKSNSLQDIILQKLNAKSFKFLFDYGKDIVVLSNGQKFILSIKPGDDQLKINVKSFVEDF
jgi:hypothetical protein